MSIPFTCPTCAHTHSADESLAGKKARCRCGTILDVPFPNAVSHSIERAVVQCTACSKKLSYSTAQAGKLARCSCGEMIRLPEVILKANASLDVEFQAFQNKDELSAPARPLMAAGLNTPSIDAANSAPWAGASNWIRQEVTAPSPTAKPIVDPSDSYETIPGVLVLIGVLDCLYALFALVFGGFYLITGGFFTSHKAFALYGALTMAYSFYNFGCMVAYGCSSFFSFNRYRIGWYVMSTVHAFGLMTTVATVGLATVSFQVSTIHVMMLFSAFYGCWVLYTLFQEDIRNRFFVDKSLKSAAYAIGIPGVALGAIVSLSFFAADLIVARQYPTGMPWEGRGDDEPDWGNMDNPNAGDDEMGLEEE